MCGIGRGVRACPFLLRNVAGLVAQGLHRPFERGTLEHIQAAIQLVAQPLLLLREIGERLAGVATAERIGALVEPAQLIPHLRRQRITQQLLRLVQP